MSVYAWPTALICLMIERILLGDGTWSAGLCSERGERKPPCARNHPRHDCWFRQIHQVTKRVGIQLSNHRKLLINSNVFVKFACYCKLTNSWYWSGDCYIRAKMICWLQIIPAYCVFGKPVFVWHFQFQLQRQSHEGRHGCVQTCWNASTISWQGIHIINIHLCNNCSLIWLMIWTICLFQRLQKASLNRKSNSSVSTECIFP